MKRIRSLAAPRPVRVGAVAGVILAGGHGSRLFPDGRGEKALAELAGQSLAARVADRFAPQVFACALNSASTDASLRRLGLPLVRDASGERLGPLAGLLAGMEWAKRAAPTCPLVASVPVDAPFLPSDLVARLAGQMQAVECEIVLARRGGQGHFITGLWHVSLAASLAASLAQGTRKVEDYLATREVAFLDWPLRGPDPFFNINAPADLRRAEARIAKR